MLMLERDGVHSARKKNDLGRMTPHVAMRFRLAAYQGDADSSWVDLVPVKIDDREPLRVQ